MSGNTTKSGVLLYSELKSRTNLDTEEISPIINRAERTNKSKKYLHLLTGEANDKYETASGARLAAEEEFMFVTNGSLDQTVEIIKKSELVDDTSKRVLRAETQSTFTILGMSTYDDKDSWVSTNESPTENRVSDSDDDDEDNSGSGEQIIREKTNPVREGIGDPDMNKNLRGM
jgi:hypothetical protein